jgi:DNA mismatch endonuclease (patch repair protein)
MSGDSVPQRTVRVAMGVDVPYPIPSSATASRIGRSNGRKDTKPEISLRSSLHRSGLRFRKDHLVRTRDGRTRVKVDICFTGVRIAVFVDGCFWHVCPLHHVPPRSNAEYWVPKLAANVARDRRVDAALELDGWQVVRVWEHDVPSPADNVVREAVAAVRQSAC